MGTESILVLVALNKDRTDIGGNKFPDSGFVESDSFSIDKDIRDGICGVVCGRTSKKPFLDIYSESVWCVVRVALDDHIIHIDDMENLVKFKSGFVVYSGSLYSCAEYISNHAFIPDNLPVGFSQSSVAGSVLETSDYYSHALNSGFKGKSITNVSCSNSIVTGDSASAETTAPESHAVAFGSNSRAATLEDDSYAVALARSSRARSCGDHSISIATGIDSTVLNSGEEGIAVALGIESKGSAGPDGVLILSYIDDRLRFKVGYVGEDIEAGKVYRVINGKFSEVNEEELLEA